MDLEDLERTLHDRLEAVGLASRAVLRHTLLLPTASVLFGSASSSAIPGL
jgi:hypothetical protein